jgi:antitoxin HigA-1
LIITKDKAMTEQFAPIHPGEILLEEFLKPIGLSQYRLALDINVPPRSINEIVHGTRAITPDRALRLSRYFGNTAMFWLNLQMKYDLSIAREQLGQRLLNEVKVMEAPADYNAQQTED